MSSLPFSRRSFLLGSSALAMSGCAYNLGERQVSPDKRASRLRLKFGVLSDIHITDWASTEIFRKTLRYFRSQRVDAVMIVGDMADHGLLCQLENVAKSWNEVFPNGKGIKGEPVEKLFVMGNHDADGLYYRDAAMDKAFAVHGFTYEAAAEQTLRKLGFAACWEKCFGEKFEPIYRKSVKGYTFIGAHWDTWEGVGGLETWFANHAAEIPTDRPFFYFQHNSPRGTVYGADSWGDDDGRSVRALSAYPNAVAFSGHSHRPLTDERSYWRGEFTSIGTSTLSYVCLPHNGHMNMPNYRENLDCRHGQIVSVFDNRLEIERRDFIHDESLGDVIVLPMPTEVGSFAVRGVKRSALPAFPDNASLVMSREKEGVSFLFPAAFANPSARPYDYSIWCTFTIRDKDGKVTKKQVNHIFFQPDFCFSRARSASSVVVSFVLKGKDIPAEFESAEASVYARNNFGVQAPTRLTGKL